MREDINLSRREVIKVMGAAALSGLGAVASAQAQQAEQTAALPEGARRPNIIITMSDDQSYETIGAYGNPWVRSPNIDRLAREGARFDRAFVTNSLCAPSRASILTGLYSHTHLVCTNRITPRLEEVTLDKRFVTFPEILQQHGYETAFIGKSHFAPYLRDRGFDYYFGFRGQGWYQNPSLAEATDRSGPYEDRIYQGHMTDILTDRAVQFLRRPHERPFLMLLWHKAPHTPLEPQERFADLYGDHEFLPPPTWDADRTGKPMLRGRPPARDSEAVRNWAERQRKYYQLLAGVDESVGRVMATLEELGIADDTVFIHTSDNGFFMGQFGLGDKRLMYEPSIRVPLLIRYPRLVRPGTVITHMVLNVDIAPTVLDLAGVPVPEHMHGRSFLPLLRGQDVEWRQDWLYEYYEIPQQGSIMPFRGIRTERYKMIYWHSLFPPQVELYDLEADPDELHNLAADPQYEGLIEELHRRMRALRHETGDPDIWKN